MAKVPNGVEISPKVSIAWVGCTNVTDDRQTDDRRTTDGRTMTSSECERSLKTMDLGNWLPFTHFWKQSINLWEWATFLLSFAGEKNKFFSFSFSYSGGGNSTLRNKQNWLCFNLSHWPSQDFCLGCTFFLKKVDNLFSRRLQRRSIYIITTNWSSKSSTHSKTCPKIDSCSTWGCTWCAGNVLTNLSCKLRLIFLSALLHPLAKPMPCRTSGCRNSGCFPYW